MQKKQAIFFIGLILALFTLIVLPQSASAAINLNPDPGSSVPGFIRNYLRNCDRQSRTPGLSVWISPSSNSAATTATVNYGTTNISLAEHFSGAVCHSYSNVLRTKQHVVSASSSDGLVSGLAGKTQEINFTGFYGPGNFNQPGTYRHSKLNFSFAPQGGFVQSRTYRISTRIKQVNNFQNGSKQGYQCVAASKSKEYIVQNINDISRCEELTVNINIRVNVASHEPVGTAKAECDLSSGARIKISGVIYDPDYPGLIYTTFRINNWQGEVIDGPTKRGKPIEFYSTNATLLDGNGHWLRMMSYDNNNPNKNWYTNDVNNPENNLPLIWSPPCKANNNSACTPFTGGFGLPAASSGEEIALRTIGGQPIPGNKISPGQDVLLGVSMKNNGKTVWQGALGVYALTPTNGNVVSAQSAPAPYNNWSVINTPPPIRIGYQGGGGTTAPGQTVNFWFRVTTPSNPGEDVKLEFKMRQTVVFDGRPAETFGGICSINLVVPRDKPYVSFYGNDVLTGAKFEDDINGGCTISAPGDGDIKTYSEKRPGSNTWAGASSQLAAFVKGEVDGFFTANQRNGSGPAPTTAAGLTFGNYNDGVLSEGGGDSGIEHCLPDYFDGVDPSSVTQGNKQIGPKNISNGSKETIYINGDADIRGNIVYSGSGGWTSLDQIPNFRLVVKGNIYIDRSVTQVDGTYVALPIENGGTVSGGEIITCAVAGAKPANNSAIKNNCGNKLTVNGSFIAYKVHFLRIKGKLEEAAVNESAATSKAAEVFNFSPESYIVPLDPTASRNVKYDKYDYITSLPPIL